MFRTPLSSAEPTATPPQSRKRLGPPSVPEARSRRLAGFERCPWVAAFLARYLYSHHVEDRLLPLKQTVSVGLLAEVSAFELR